MNENLITQILTKIRSLKNEIKTIQYTMEVDGVSSDNDIQKINECTHKIQVLNEVIISFGIQK